jgi:Leucine-rich repeat (LRR) protein
MNLASKGIINIESGLFEIFNNVEYLNLESNQIDTLKVDSLKGLTKLKTLIISKNNILRIEDNAFSNMIALEHLELYGNRIQAIDCHFRCCLLKMKSKKIVKN